MNRLCLAALLLISCSQKKPPIHLAPPKVYVSTVKVENVPVYIEAVGHIRGLNEVEIKAQVEGVLEKVHYTQGSRVMAGDPLITIDPRPYQAALDKAKAILLEYQAQLAFSQDKVKRYTPLVGNNFVSQLDYDQYTTDQSMNTARVEEAKADVMTAQVNLSYCYIHSPINGRVGRRLVDEGNLIANDGSTLVTVYQISPCYVDFSICEADLIKVMQAMRSATLQVQAITPGSSAKSIGKLEVIDNMVDPSTGMIMLRAFFENNDETLWPGQFARVQLITGQIQNAVLIPVEAVNNGQNGKFVFLIEEGNTAQMKRIEIGQRIGEYFVVTKGLEPTDTVIYRGQLNVRPGGKVQIVKE